MTQASTTSAGQTSINRDHPYLGLQAFSEQDYTYFYGRDSEISDIFRLVRRDVLTVLFGISGLGKTSLLNAGLFPRLRKERYLPIPIRLDFGPQSHNLVSQVKERVAKALEVHCVDTPSPTEQETLWEYFQGTHFWNQQNHLLTPVLVFDQFEELFTLGRRDDRVTPFLQEMSDLIENHIPETVRKHLEKSGEELPFSYNQAGAKVIFSLREDYLAPLEELRSLIPSLWRNRYRLTRMNGTRALEAVYNPGKHLQTEAVAENIVRFAAGDTEQTRLEEIKVEPALLSLVCHELNSQRIESGLSHITSKLLSGSKDRIISNFYSKCVAGFKPGVRVFIEDHLLTASGYRSTKALDDALQLPGVNKKAIDSLVNRRLLRLEDRLGIQHVELIHDVLARVILKSRRRRHEKKALSKREDARRKLIKKRIRWALGIAAGIWISGLTIAGLIAYDERDKAQKAQDVAEGAQAKAEIAQQNAETAQAEAEGARLDAEAARVKAESRELAQSSSMHTELDPMLSLILAQAANKKDVTPQAVGALHGALITSQIRHNLTDHKKTVLDVAYSHDGKWVATASVDKTAKLWNTETGKLKYTFKGDKRHKSSINALAFSPDGKWVATASRDKTAKLWNTETGKLQHTFKEDVGHKSSINALAFSPDGKWVATASQDKTTKLWYTETGELRHTLEGDERHKSSIIAVAFSPYGKWLATTSFDNSTKLWRTETGEFQRTLNKQQTGSTRRPRRGAMAPAFSPDGKVIATSNMDANVNLWNTETGELSGLLKKETGKVTAVAFKPDGTQLATTYNDGTVLLFDIKSGEKQQIFKDNRSISKLAFSPDGTQLAITSGKNAKVLNPVHKSQIFTLTGHTSRINALAFSPDGEQLITASRDRTAKLWNVAHNEELPTLTGHRDKIRDIIFNPDGKWLASSENNMTKLWDTRTGKIKDTLVFGEQNQAKASAVAISPDGDWIAIAKGYTVRLWNTKTHKVDHILKKHKNIVKAMAFSPDGRLLASASRDGTAILWKIRSGEELHTFGSGSQNNAVRPRNYINDVTFSPDGRSLATGHRKGSIRLWDVVSGKRITTLLPLRIDHRSVEIYDLAFSPSQSRIAATTADSSVIVWDLELEEELFVLKGHKSKINALVFSPNETFLATASDDKSVKLWDMETRREYFTLLGHTGPVTSVAFSPDGKQLASGSTDTTVRRYVIDIEKLKVLAEDRITRKLSHEECNIFYQLEECEVARLLKEGQKLARAEKIELAIQKFTEARKLDQEVKFVPDLKFEEQPVANLYTKFLAARGLSSQAKNLVRNGDASLAIETLERAKIYDPDIKIDKEKIKIDAARSLASQARSLARQGNTIESYEAVTRALALDPGLNTNIKTDIAKRLIQKGKSLVRKGNPEGAEGAFEIAKKLDPETDIKIKEEIAKALISKGRTLARTGDSEEALQAFVKALKLNPKLDLKPKEEIAKGLVSKGKTTAWHGKTDEASEIFKKAVSLYPDLKLDPKVELAKGLVAYGRRKARAGDLEATTQAFHDAKEFDPGLKVDIKLETAKALLQKGRREVKSGRVKEAIASYEKAQSTSSFYKITAKNWNTLCWDGTLWGHAQQVLFACDHAVTLKEKNPGYHDSRGLARAVTGNVAGAIEDFKYYVAFGPKPPYRKRKEQVSMRENWITALEAGENPFPPSVLKALRSKASAQ